MTHSHPRGVRSQAAACGVLLLAGLMACGDNERQAGAPFDASAAVQVSPAAGTDRTNPDTPVRITATRGHRITDVVVADAAGRMVKGALSPDRTSWHSRSPLAAGVRYTVRVQVTDRRGASGRSTAAFTTAPADTLLRAELSPRDGTYGVGQPVTAQLSHPITEPAARALVERGLKVTSVPRVSGRWHWVDERTLHWRPRTYWPTHATVTVESRLAGLRIRNGLYGGPTAAARFTVGDRIEAKVDAAKHTMTVLKNGKEIRRIPVTTGKPGFETRNGVKIVLGQERQVRMTGTSIGIAAGSSEGYDLQVHWATRLTWSGEYVHAAPWSAASHGRANVSHGCTGMSMEAAEWFFRLVRPGDIVSVTGSQGESMPAFGNGFGDWNMPWDHWVKGSAFHDPAVQREYGEDVDGTGADRSARLRPSL